MKKAGFKSAVKARMIANESALWRRRVFSEYYNGMKNMISGLSNPKSKMRFRNKLETLKKNIAIGKEIHWAWGVNYLVEAQK